MGDARTVDGDFSLLETMRLDEGRLARRDAHLARMARTAAACGYAWDPMRVAEALATVEAARPLGRWRVRLLLSRHGEPTVECVAFPTPTGRPWRVGFASGPVRETPLLRIKTTDRRTYDEARRGRPALDDVLLWTSRDEVTESTIANIVADIDGTRCTPPASSPLLAGIFRAELLASGLIVERRLSTADVAAARRMWLVNSLREWIEADLEGPVPGA
jgi:para-aminobenzoate synthetase/4-amino-4-deoxychorismate lyase